MATNCIDVVCLLGAGADKLLLEEVHTGLHLSYWVQNAAETGPRCSRGVAFISIASSIGACLNFFLLVIVGLSHSWH
jgi:hypothetical protein